MNRPAWYSSLPEPKEWPGMYDRLMERARIEIFGGGTKCPHGNTGLCADCEAAE